ncbi:MBL fold metallo-hydrolase [Phenylobacterium sp.]|uniref:MBL fold metallo-hydrolase n=1 Tax=Phenylobacterium sp. TaxID=1871053 RepID=UPI0025F7E0C3|nr:MBL fold metallo-hydrolase [Phenylobacterium sp.]
MKRIAVVIAGLLALVLAGAWLFRGEIALQAMARTMDRNLAASPADGLPDGLHVALCGSGSPMPDPSRAGPCTAVLAGERLFVFDSGAGSVRNLTLMGMAPARVERVFLTHFHSDHIDGLGELMLQHWAGGAAKAPLPVHGPTGVETVVSGLMTAYDADRGYRIAHHGETVVPPSGFGGEARPFAIASEPVPVTLIDEPDLKIRAFAVDHAPVSPAVGYIVEYKGRKVVISGDTDIAASVEQAAQNADLLVHEALSLRLVGLQKAAAERAGRANLVKIFADITDYHADPEAIAALAGRAKVRYLLLTHIVPPLPLRALEGPFLGDSRKIFDGPVRVGRDGDMITLPAGSADIRHSNRLR